MAQSVFMYVGTATYDLTKYVAQPVLTNEDISKVLDTIQLSIPLIPASIDSTSLPTTQYDMSNVIKPLTKISVFDDGKEFAFIVREDKRDKIYDVGEGSYYEHAVSLIEQTKLLELRPLADFTITQPRSQSKLVTQPLESTTVEALQGIETNITYQNTTASNDNTVIDGTTLKLAGLEYNISTLFRFITTVDTLVTVRIKANAVEIANKQVLFTESDDFVDLGVSYTSSVVNEVVTVTVESSATDLVIDGGSLVITAVQTIGTDVLYTYSDVIDKTLLEVYDMNDTTYSQEFDISDELRARLNGIDAPEKTYTRETIQGVLEDLADDIEAIQRMADKVIDFDFINEINRVEFTGTYETKESKEINLQGYANSLEINADNVIESVERQAVVIEPYQNGWLTFRADTDGPEQITDTNVSLKLRFPQYENKKVYAKGFLVTYSDATTSPTSTVWDISDYVVEEERWNVLPNLAYDSAVERQTINLGKGNTISYKSSDKRMLKFGYRAPKKNSVTPLPDQVIYQIIAAVATQVSGKQVSSVQPNGGAQSITNLLQTQYRVEHVASPKLRSRVYKHDAKDFEENATLYTNEQAKVNDTAKLGANAQSLVNRSGNTLTRIAGMCETRTQLPKVGNTIGDGVITNVGVQIENGFYIWEAWVFDNYTAISDLIGVDSAFRQWQIPKEEIVERNLIYTEPIAIVTTLGDTTHSIMTVGGISNLTLPFTNNPAINTTYCEFLVRFNPKVPTDPDWDSSFDVEAEGPVDIKPVGNTTHIKFETKDNYSVDDIKEDFDTTLTPPGYYQNDFPYKDAIGRFDSARYIFYGDGFVNNSVADGEVYPEINQVTADTKLIEVDVKVLADAREQINFSVDIPFFGGEGVTVYKGIAKYNGFAVQDANTDIVTVVFEGTKPNPDQTLIGNTQYLECSYVANAITGIDYVQIDYTLTIDSPVNKNYQGWGMIERNTGELIFLVDNPIPVQGGVTKIENDTLYWKPDKTFGA